MTIKIKRTLPQVDECKFLILKLIEQAIRDFLSLEYTNNPDDKYDYETACQFIFDDNYYINWGGMNRNLYSFLEILDIDITWLREQVVRKKNKRLEKSLKKRSIYENIIFIEEDETKD